MPSNPAAGHAATTNPPLLLKVLDLLALLVDRLIPWFLLLVVIVVFRRLAGFLFSDYSTSETWIAIMANVSRTRAFALIFGFFGILYGLQQRSLRRQAVARLSARVRTLEGTVQPARIPPGTPGPVDVP